VTEISANAKKMLKYFQDHRLGPDVYEAPARLEALFADVKDCERAQAELAMAGLIKVAQSNPHATSKVVALSLDGVRYLEKNPIA
jgi:hypothetical protein